MNFKPLYVSLLALGLVSGSAMAATGAKAVKANAKVTKAEAVLNQNAASSPVCTMNWANRIFVGGLLNVDALWGSHSPIYSFTRNGSGSDFVVNNANVFVDANINKWVKAHINLAYLGYKHNLYLLNSYAAPKSNALLANQYGGDFGLDEAYITVSNFAQSPFYLRAGEQYVSYGDYARYPMVRSLTQELTQTRAAALSAGFVTDMGFYFNAFAFNGPTNHSPTFDATKGELDKVPNVRNFGGKIGYYGNMPALGLANTHYNIDMSYLRNMYDVDAVYGAAFALGTGGGWNTASVANGVDPVGGLSFHLDVTHGPVDFVANYVTALRDLIQSQNQIFGNWNKTSSKLSAGELTAGYSFKTIGHDSRVALSYQWSNNGEFTAYNATDLQNTFAMDPQFVSLPKTRWMANYQVNLLSNTDLGFAIVHDKSYDYTNMNTGVKERRESNTGLARLSVQF